MPMRLALLLMLTSCTALAALPSIQVSQAWTRASIPGQDVGAAYMRLSSDTDVELVKVESTAAGSVELHSMRMDGGVMKMRMLTSLPLKAGQAVSLAPGGNHLMLFDLKQPLKTGSQVSYTLHLRDAAGRETTQQLSTPVRDSAP